ncbi:hypothetical protein [Archangium sp.]|uniref:hypothetical protein n=1 Tax=Archangium sp. TaxID=1872627 RepID=UPI002D3D5318|nr:hypothetical protein [Archangium sp.]HYO59465.1 hypothetical protein [Archangium sp.]
MEIKFTEPVTVRALRVYVGRMDPTRMSAEDYHPVAISAVWDTGEVALDPTENGQNALEIPQVAGQQVTRLLLRLPRAPKLDRCLSEVELELEEGPWVHGLPSAAIAALPQAVAAITRAFRACDTRELGRHVLFPLTSRKLLGEHGTLSRMFSTSRISLYPNARALTRDCRWWVVPSDDEEGRQPHVIGSEAPRTVRVWANYHAGVKYWRLRWDGHRWWLVGFDASDFE